MSFSSCYDILPLWRYFMEYYIDLGSSTIKVYQYQEKLVLLEEHSIYFKNDFDSEKGISPSNLEELCRYFNELLGKYHFRYETTHIFVTGIFRNLNSDRRCELVKLFNEKFDLHFNIISHGIENYYLAKAMEHEYNDKKVLIINMGGKTTELVTYHHGRVTDTKNLTIGVAEMLNQFSKVNDSISGNSVEEMEAFVLDKLSTVSFDDDYDCAIFTGGEERFELLTKFPLVKNTLFDDGIHSYMISLDDYVMATKRVFFEYTMEDLYKLMSSNPKWMDGARSGAVLPLAIFRKANISWIVPSDLNLIHGVIRDERS